MKGALVLLIVLAAASARADLTGDWRKARDIAAPAMQPSGQVYLPLDEATLAGVETLSEYRVVRAGKVEIPYRMVEERGQTETYALSVKTVAQSAPGIEPQEITLDLGDRPASRLRLTLQLIGSAFRCRAGVEGSPDGKQWRMVTVTERLFRLGGGIERSDLLLPFRADRFLRLRLFREQGPLPRIEQIRVSSETVIARQLLPVAAGLSRKEEARERRTILTLDTQRLTRDLAEARFEIAEAAFDRSIGVEAKEQGNTWEYRGAGALKRLAGGSVITLPLDIPRTRQLRFSIANGDDAPLTIQQVTLWRVRRGLIFSAEPGQRYELWYGRPNALTPAYELERLPLTTPPAALPQASLGAERAVPPAPAAPKLSPAWSEQHPWVFWSSLTGVVALLLLLIVRSMRGAGGHSTAPVGGTKMVRREP